MFHYVMKNKCLLSGVMWIQILQETLIKGNPILVMCLHLQEQL